MHFFKYVSKNYASWIQVPDERSPLMSHQFVQKKLLPHLQSSDKLVWIVVDNLRYDQLKVVEPLLSQHFKVLEESAYFPFFQPQLIIAGMLFLQDCFLPIFNSSIPTNG